MGFQLNATPAAQVTISGAVSTSYPDIPTGATRVCKSLYQTATGGTKYTVHTTTATKTLYVTAIWISCNGITGSFRVGDNVGTTFVSTTVTSNAIEGTAVSWSGSQVTYIVLPVALACATDLSVVVSGNCTLSVGFIGYEI